MKSDIAKYDALLTEHINKSAVNIAEVIEKEHSRFVQKIASESNAIIAGIVEATANELATKLTWLILVLSLILSQFISNVPLVALYLPLLVHHHLPGADLLALAVGSTIAGNLSILGAASNVIIVQNTEKRNAKGFGFFEFIKLGLPLTIINILIYAFFLLKEQWNGRYINNL